MRVGLAPSPSSAARLRCSDDRGSEFARGAGAVDAGHEARGILGGLDLAGMLGQVLEPLKPGEEGISSVVLLHGHRSSSVRVKRARMRIIWTCGLFNMCDPPKCLTVGQAQFLDCSVEVLAG